MTIDEIYRKGDLGIRAYRFCKLNDIHTVYDLKKIFVENKSIAKIKNFGKKTKEELIIICNSFPEINFESSELQPQKENPLKLILSELTSIQRNIINNFILINTNSLSTGSKNAITSYLEGDFKINSFVEKIFLLDNFTINNIKNVGSKYALELEVYIHKIKCFLTKISESKDKKYLTSLKNNFIIQRIFSISEIPTEVLESESIFLLTEFLLSQNALFNKTKTTIVTKGLKIYQDAKELTLDEIASDVDLSRERVRQIRVNCVNNLFEKLLFIQKFEYESYKKYNIDVNLNYLIITNELVDVINEDNNTNFTKTFIAYLISVSLDNEFQLVGNINEELYSNPKISSDTHQWNNFYLVKKNVITELDFNSLVNDIRNRLSKKIKETYSFCFKSYLSKFIKNNNIEILSLAFPIAENIVNEEFELYLDLEGNIILKRNTIKKAHEYTYAALEKLGKQSKVKEIFEKVIELYPNYVTDEAKIRSSMKRINGFVPIGRTSVFGLEKWEDELIDFKGGTIREIVEEYLSQFSIPKHISDITKHVLIYRPKSNQHSIFQNLKFEKTGLYKFYANSKVGLSTIEYDTNFILDSEINNVIRKSWEKRLEELSEFIKTNKRLPFSSGVNNTEIKLYRWLNDQNKKYEDYELIGEKRKKFKKVFLNERDKNNQIIKQIENTIAKENLKGIKKNKILIESLMLKINNFKN